MCETTMSSPALESTVDRSTSKARRLIGVVALCGCAICIIRLEPWSRIPVRNHNRLLLGQGSGITTEYPIRLTFALPNVNRIAPTVDIFNLEMHDLGDS